MCTPELGNVLKSLPFASISTVIHLNFDTKRKDDLENDKRRRDGPSSTFVPHNFGPRRRVDPRSIDFDATRRITPPSCVKKRTDDATGRQWGRGMEGLMAMCTRCVPPFFKCLLFY